MTDRLDRISEARAAKQYEKIKGFYIHCFIYVFVCLLLVLVNVLKATEMWAQWPILGWGAGVAYHAYCAFITTPKNLAKWEATQLEEARSRQSAAKT